MYTMPRHECMVLCRSRSQGRGRVVHLGTLLAFGLLVLLLLAAAGGHAGSWGSGLVDYEAGVALLWVPLEAHEVGLLELVVCL
jgi:hypothetical protein